MRVTVQHRLPDVVAQVGAVPGIAADAQRSAVNTVAQSGRDAIYARMAQVFDRPTPYALRALRIERARANGPAAAAVMVKGRQDVTGGGIPAQSFLRAEILGGGRRWKRFEVAMQRASLLPPGWYAVPGKGARMDAFGNMSRGQVVQLMSYLQLFRAGAARANMSDKRRQALRRGTKSRRGSEYFVVLVNRTGPAGHGGKLAPGIWERADFGQAGRGVRLVVAFVRHVRYRVRLDFFGELVTHAAGRMADAMDSALRRARAARPLRDAR